MNDELPNIAIIGGGPIGIEAALYARFLGYPARLYEQGELCSHVRSWGHVQLFSPFGLNSSSLGVSALKAQNPQHEFPADDQLHTGHQWAQQYLEPLAQTDLIRSCVRTHTRVDAIARDTTQIDQETSRMEVPFRIMLTDADGNQLAETADIVIDATGTWAKANPLGRGGTAAMGESPEMENALPGQTLFHRRIPDLKETELAEGSRLVVIGRGFSAATNIIQLKELHERDPSIRCIWLTRVKTGDDGPVPVIENDPLPYREELARAANAVARQAEWLQWKPGVEVSAIKFADGHFLLSLSDGQELHVDHVIANTGFHGDYEMLDALKIQCCYESGGPMAWAVSVANTSSDCLQQKSTGPDALRTTEPDFYIIGSKSYGPDPRFLFATGLQQIRDVFKIIAERDTLDLYATLLPNTSVG